MSNFHTEELSQWSFSPLSLREISVLTELHLGRMRYRFTYEPPQPNSPSETFLHQDLSSKRRMHRCAHRSPTPDWEFDGVEHKPEGAGVFTPPPLPQQAPPHLLLPSEGGPHASLVAPAFSDINARNRDRGVFVCSAAPFLFAMQ